MIKKTSLNLITLFALSNTTLIANDLKPMLQFGYDFGGETLATVERYDYYNGYETNRVRAGQGLSFEAGAAIDTANSDLELQFLVGYKFDRESASNGSVTWDQIPFTALAMLKKHQWKFGGGITYHLNPELTGNFTGYDNNNNYFNDSVDDKYENSVGGVIQIQYMMSEASAIGLRGTFIEYKLKNDSSVVANGNSIGVNFSYQFGERSEFR
ncbi:MAG: Unknown protein [uncultured Sulfurovum sp.]|uniref:Outer membrane protein beta-barrel domain-containing protein n=1 Tax=uncultured Sulfurovum sp. TaxID=269237 RepID=A0A6S6TK89_9BACT|nr:MAG: Unknown protein [uncultured Sulfurovum sp.]